MVQLVNVRDCALHWAEKFDEKFTDVFAVEDSISEQVVNALALKLTSRDRRMLAKRPTESVEAYEAYLKGQYFYDKRAADGCNKGIQYFEQAIKADPKFAMAYVGLADCYDWLRIGNVLSRADANLKTETALLRALELDSELAIAHSTLGILRTRQWDWSTADREFRKAIDLNPRVASVRAGYAIFLLEMGRFDDALAEINCALKLNPLSLSANFTLGSVLYFTRQYDKAVEQAYRTLELADFSLAYVCLGYAYEAQGKYGEALAAFRRARRNLREGPEITTCFARIHALTGRKDKALKVVHQLSRQPKKYCLTPNSIALIYEALGDAEQAFMWLETAYTEHDDDLALLKIDPKLDSLRGDPRFMSLLERIGLAD
jgi:tetratricopeptide (TPR) repeat protein